MGHPIKIHHCERFGPASKPVAGSNPARAIRGVFFRRAIMVREIRKMYQSSDGAEFGAKAEAEAHEELIDCMEEYRIAKHQFTKAVLKTQETADGKPFDLERIGDYYRVREWPYFPVLERVSIYPHNVTIDERNHGYVFDGKWKDGKFETTEYCISDLYHYEKNAWKALLVAQERELDIHTNTVEETRARVKQDS